jgi:hypothetical protein
VRRVLSCAGSCTSTLCFYSPTVLVALLVATSSAASIQKRDSWGGALSLGPSKSTIISAITTLIPGAAPSVQTGESFLWPGMSNGTEDLVQTTLESWPDNTWCGAQTAQWCVRASVFGSFGQLGQGRIKCSFSIPLDQTSRLGRSKFSVEI